jgi:NADP-dependent 3-hydroxy acid dehydrogenase YdfG
MKTIEQKIVLITGVSSGLGAACAEYLSNIGHIVYGTSRKSINKSGAYEILKMDLTDLQSIKQAVETILQEKGRIDVLVNNAGMHTGGAIETSAIENIELQMNTNFIGMVHTVRTVLPAMRKQGNGTIINVSSIGGLMGLPFQAFYSASKFAIEGFSDALRMELKQFNVKVIVINPGDFHTNNTENRRKYISSWSDNDPYEHQFKKTLSIIEKDENGGWSPQILARILCRIIEKKNPRQRYVIASFEQKLAVILKYILPGSWFNKILEGHYGIK